MCMQILHNIFSNFIKYAGPDATLHCTYEKTRKEYILTFADDGVGIPDEELSLVREKFYRVSKSRTRDVHMSMGIGLSIIDRIARVHGGTMEISKNGTKGVLIQVKIVR